MSIKEEHIKEHLSFLKNDSTMTPDEISEKTDKHKKLSIESLEKGDVLGYVFHNSIVQDMFATVNQATLGNVVNSLHNLTIKNTVDDFIGKGSVH